MDQRRTNIGSVCWDQGQSGSAAFSCRQAADWQTTLAGGLPEGPTNKTLAQLLANYGRSWPAVELTSCVFFFSNTAEKRHSSFTFTFTRIPQNKHQMHQICLAVTKVTRISLLWPNFKWNVDNSLRLYIYSRFASSIDSIYLTTDQLCCINNCLRHSI